MPIAFRYLLGAHGAYFLITGSWPVIDLENFMKTTGYQGRYGSANLLGCLLIVVGFFLFRSLNKNVRSNNVAMMSFASAVSLSGFDFYNGMSGSAGNMYLVDAIIQLAFVLGWIVIGLKLLGNRKN